MNLSNTENNIMATKTEVVNGFTMEYSMLAKQGAVPFLSKWKKVQTETKESIKDRLGNSWTCVLYKIGKDISKSDALKDFENDSQEFDVYVVVKVIKCDITLIEENIMLAGYSYIEDEANEYLDEMVEEYSYKDDITELASDKLVELLENLG